MFQLIGCFSILPATELVPGDIVEVGGISFVTFIFYCKLNEVQIELVYMVVKSFFQLEKSIRNEKVKVLYGFGVYCSWLQGPCRHEDG